MRLSKDHEGLFLVRSVTNNLMKQVNSDVIRYPFMKDLFFVRSVTFELLKQLILGIRRFQFTKDV